MNKTILLFGASGMLGTRITELLKSRYKILSPSRQELDLKNHIDLDRYLSQKKYDFVVYAAGITNQEEAEKNKDLALAINSKASDIISKKLKNTNIPVIYFSTDAVFKGDSKENPYLESDKTKPVNYYGYTKAKGEESVLSESSKNSVIRLVSLFTGKYENKPDFVKKIISSLSKKQKCYGIIDQYFNPSFTDDVVFGLNAVISKNISGIFHFGSQDYITNLEFSKKIAGIFKFNANNVVEITFKDFFKKSLARYGQYTWLSVEKTQKKIGKNILHTNADNILKIYNNYYK